MDIRCGYIDHDGGQVHYRTTGRDGPAILCFHQTPLSSRMYERALPHLGRAARAFAFDTPGYGASSPPAAQPGVGDYGKAMLAAADGLGIETFVVCGFATGSAIALEVARRAGPRVSHAVLSGTPLLSAERQRMFEDRLGGPDLRADGSHLLRTWDARVENYGTGGDAEQVHMAVTETMRSYERLDWGLKAVKRYDVGAALRDLRVPTLFLTADGDKLAPDNRKAAALVPGAVERVIAGARPQLCWTDPERFACEVFDFLGLTVPGRVGARA